MLAIAAAEKRDDDTGALAFWDGEPNIGDTVAILSCGEQLFYCLFNTFIKIKFDHVAFQCSNLNTKSLDC